MTRDQIRARIGAFAEYAQTDPERFHVQRDDLYRSVLREIASYLHGGGLEAAALAAVALEAEHITPAWEACS